mmetsp:Transcript_76540/g.215306  ORF Transcript_76540/g.215306 Transcript_76540/m.215306 type:complete len:430 (+) Transcript_76540:477-1766(+)
MRLEARAGVQGDDGRRRLLGAQAVVVASVRHATPHDLVVLAEAIGQASDARHEEHPGFVRLAGVEEVHACVRADRPVVVLAIAVDASKGLLVKQRMQAQFLRLTLQDLHEEHVVVGGEGGLAVDGGHLVLRGSDLVVEHSHGHAQGQNLRLHVEEQLLDLLADRREVVEIAHLVALRQLADQRAAAIHEVRTLAVQVSPDHEELLLPTEVGVDRLGVCAELDVLQQAQALLLHRVVGAQQRRFVVDAVAEVRDEGAGDAEHLVQHVARRRAVPRREGRGRVRGAEAAVGEGGAVGLADEEALVGQRGEEGLVGLGRAPIEVDQDVHLAGAAHAAVRAAAATHGEEPMREGDGTKLPRPLEDGLCDHLLVVLARRSARDQGLLEASVDPGGQPRFHCVVVKDQRRHLRELIALLRAGAEHLARRCLAGCL